MLLKSKPAFALAIIAMLLLAAFQRNIAWLTETAVWLDAAQKSDGKSRPHANLGMDYDRGGDLNRAEKEYKRAISLEPAYLAPYAPLAVLYGKRGDIDKAIEMFLWVIPRLPFKDYKAHTGLGAAYMIKGLFEKAEKEFLEAVSINPNDEVARYNLAELYERMGLRDEAAKQRREILRMRMGERALTGVY